MKSMAILLVRSSVLIKLKNSNSVDKQSISQTFAPHILFIIF